MMVMSAAATAGLASNANAFDLGAAAGKGLNAVTGKSRDKLVAKLNAKLLAEGRKNQCSFKSDSDELAPGCDAKVRRLAKTLADVKKNLQVSGVTSYKFEVAGHTDTSGSADHNKALSEKRAAVIVKELVAVGVDPKDIVAVGMGSERPLVKDDNTPAKKAKNRRYEIQIRF